MSVLKFLLVALLASFATPKKSEDFETGSSYNKIHDTTTVYARCWLHTSDIQDSIQLSYTFKGKKQTEYIAPRWTLALYHRNNPGNDPQTVSILVNDKGPAENLKLTFVEHDHQFNGDTFEAALDERLEKILLNSRMLEFFPPRGETAGSCKLTGADLNSFKTYLRNSRALKRPN